MKNLIKKDIVIIGSGIAGALAAYTLAKNGLNVLLLEAGPNIQKKDIIDNFTKSPFLDYSTGYPNNRLSPRPNLSNGLDNYISYSKKNLKLEYLKNVGGTTWHWAGITARLLPADFQMRTLYGKGENWPITYNELEPYYVKAEYEIGVSGDDKEDYKSPRSAKFPQPPSPTTYTERLIASKLEDFGLSFVNAPVARNSTFYDGRNQCQGFGTCSPICPSGALYNASVHVDKAIKEGAELIYEANVTKLYTGENGKISSIEFTKPDNSTYTVMAKEFILAANAIETPKLLMMSADKQFPNGLANSSGMVGKNLFGHPGVDCEMTLNEPTYYGVGPDHTLLSYDQREGISRAEHSSWMLSISNSIPLHQLHNITEKAIKENILPPLLDDVIKERVIHFSRISCFMEQLPDQNNKVTLNWDKKDSAGSPTINISWDTSAYENVAIKKATDFLWQVSSHLKARSVKMISPVTHHHPMGTTRMGLSPMSSVVNKDGQTHDHSNLSIISSSLFPTGGTANPTLTIAALSIMISEKLISKIKKNN